MAEPLFYLYGKYEKKLVQPYSYKKTVKVLENYFKTHKKYNIYSLASAFQMSKKRFTNNYINHKDENMRELIASAISFMAAHAMENEEEYKRTLRYILAQTEIGNPFIELDENVQQAQAKVLVLPPKE